MTEIIDFIEAYPEVTKSFNNDILHKKEFYELKLETQEDVEPGELLKHQRFLARFFSPHTPYNEALIAQEPGTGKTCVMTAIGEINKTLPLDNNPKPRTLILLNNDSLILNFRKELSKVCTQDIYTPKPTKEELERGAVMTEQTYNSRLRASISTTYELRTYGTFVNLLKQMSEEDIKNRYSNRIIMLDEAHGIRIQDNDPKTSYVYSSIHSFLHTVTHCKILLFTGTPIWDKADEIASLMNLILPLHEQLPTGKKFTKEFFEGDELKESRVHILKKAFRGRVSVLRSMFTQANKIEVGQKKPWFKYITVYPDVVSSMQCDVANKVVHGIPIVNNKVINGRRGIKNTTSIVNNKVRGVKNTSSAYKVNATDKKSNKEEVVKKGVGISRNAQQALNFVFPDKTYGTQGWKKHCVEKKGEKVNYRLDKETLKAVKDNLYTLSAKYANIIQMIKDSQHTEHKKGECIFVHNELVTGSGAILFGLCLQAHGYTWLKKPSKLLSAAPRFAIVTQDNNTIHDDNMIHKLLEEFNHPRNKYGEYIQVIIGSEKISIGYSLMNIRQIHITTPHWNMSAMEQAIARGLRYKSLDALPEKDRLVKIYMHCAVKGLHDPTQTYDIHVYKIAESKDYKKHQILRLMKIMAFDCAINYKRNLLDTDKNGSRECDYMECDYTCDGFKNSSPDDDNKNSSRSDEFYINEDELDESSYNLFYNQKDVSYIIQQINEIFSVHFSMTLNTLMGLLNQGNYQLVLQALDILINNRIPIKNRYGFSSYLKEYNNVLFLDNRITEYDEYSQSYYISHPYITELTSLEDNLEIISLSMDRRAVMEFCKNPSSDIFENLNIKTKILLMESIFASSFGKLNDKESMMTDIVLGAMEDDIYITKDDNIVHMLYAEGVMDTFHNVSIKNIEVTGKIRIFIPKKSNNKIIGGEWMTLSDSQLENNYIQEIKDMQENRRNFGLKNNPYGTYAYVSKKDKLKRMRIYIQAEKGKPERRGMECLSIKKPELYDIFKKIKFLPKAYKKFNNFSKDELLEFINSKSHKEDLSKVSIDELKKIATFYDKSIKDACDDLKDWYVDKKLFFEI